MPRRPREVESDQPHHITQRGNNRQGVFVDREDHLRYLAILNRTLIDSQIACLAFCLMPNHLHLILVPPDKDALALAMNRAQSCYAMAFNRKNARSGHLWQNRYYCAPLDETHLFQAVRYVELNPVRASMVTKAWAYEWSSAALHMGLAETTPPLKVAPWPQPLEIGPWGEYLEGAGSDADREELRIRTARGHRWGP